MLTQVFIVCAVAYFIAPPIVQACLLASVVVGVWKIYA